MTDTRDPRGIVTLTVRYLALHVVFLVGLVLTYTTDLGLIYAFGFTGVFTFFQVLASISRDFLVRAGLWEAVVIVGAVLTDVPILWWLGRLVAGIAGISSDWWLVTSWMPFHFFAAFFAWGLREIFHSPAPHKLLRPAPLTVPPIRLKQRTRAIPTLQTPRQRPPGLPKPTPTPISRSVHRHLRST